MAPAMDPKVAKALRVALGGQSVKVALEQTGYPCSKENLRKHIRNHRARSSRPAEASAAKAKETRTKPGAKRTWRRNPRQVNADQCQDLAKKRKYNAAFKEATTRYDAEQRRTGDVKRMSAPRVAREMEQKHDLAPGQIDDQRIRKAVGAGMVGASPVTKGPKVYPKAVF